MQIRMIPLMSLEIHQLVSVVTGFSGNLIVGLQGNDIARNTGCLLIYHVIET